MNERPEPVQPTVSLTAFSCPHCGALTTQHWWPAKVDYPEKGGTPLRINDPDKSKRRIAETFKDDSEMREKFFQKIDRMASSMPSIGDKFEKNYTRDLDNVDVSQCYNCDNVAIWVGAHMVWPHPNEAPAPNPDLPADVAADYLEAGEIVNASPRGAAALLRLAIQKLCIHLGGTGKNINQDIGTLVKNGLDPRVQKMLDTVRVIGNNAVHPGEMDLRDDRETAQKLFNLVNIITNITISQPKAIDDMYGSIGEGALAQIEKRDRAGSSV